MVCDISFVTDSDQRLHFFLLALDGVRIAAMAKNCHNDYKMKFSVDEEFPDLSLHNNHMAKVLLPSNVSLKQALVIFISHIRET